MACGLIVVILFTALIAPFLINWTAYRAEIENEAARILGRQVSIDGDIDIRILPIGTIRLGSVEIKSPDDHDSAALASIKQVKARLALAPLLRGKFQFTDVELVRPTFRFDVSSRGVPNWRIKTDTNFGEFMDLQNIILDDVLISGGSVFFRDARRRVAYDVSGINAQISARALVGPYAANGELLLAGQAQEFSLRAGKADAEGVRRLTLRLNVPEKEEEEIVFDGFLDTSDQGPRFDGKLIINQDIGEFEFFKTIAPAAKEKFFGKLEAKIATSFVGIQLENIKAVISQGATASRFSGRAQALWQNSSEFIVELNSKRLDLDNLLGLAGVAGKVARKTPSQKVKLTETRPSAATMAWFLSLMADALPGLNGNGFGGKILLGLDTVVVGGLAIEKLVMKLRFADNHVEVLEASGNLPGRSRLSLKGLFLTRAKTARFDGFFDFNSQNAKEFARWLIPSLDPLMGSKMGGFSGRLAAKGKLKVAPKSIDLLDMDVKLDETQISAGLSYALRQRPAFGLALSIDQIDLDRYFPPDQLKSQSSQGDFPGTEILKDIANLFVRFDANIRLSADRLISRDIAVRGFAADVGLHAGKLTIKKFDFADIGGSSLTTKGTITDINGKPSGVLEASLVAPDPTDLFEMLGIGDNSREVAKGFGPLNLDISFKSSFEGGHPHHLFKLNGSAGGTDISSRFLLLGKLNKIAQSRLDFDAEANNQDGARLLAQLGWVNPGDVKSSSQAGVLRARIKGDVNKRLEVNFDLEAYGVSGNLSGVLARVDGQPQLEASVAVKSEDARSLLSVLHVPVNDGSDETLPLSFKGLLAGGTSELVLTGFDGNVGKIPVSLGGTMVLGGRVPIVTAEVKAREMSFPWAFDAVFGGGTKPETPKAGKDQVWSALPFDLGRLRIADMKVDLLVDRLATETTVIKNVKAEIRSQRGKFDLKRLTGKLYGGELSLKATLDDVNGTLKLSSEYSLEGGELEQISRPEEKRWAIGGKTYISGNVKAEGRSVRGLFSSMKGAGVLQIEDGVLNGINPTPFAAALTSVETEVDLNNLVDGLLVEGQMSYGNLDTSFTINNGLVGTTDLRFESESATGKTSLVIDLSVYKLDNEWRFSFTDFPGSPALLLLYTGPVNAPERSFDAEGLREFLVVKTLQDSVKRLEQLEEEARKRLARKKREELKAQPDTPEPTASSTDSNAPAPVN